MSLLFSMYFLKIKTVLLYSHHYYAIHNYFLIWLILGPYSNSSSCCQDNCLQIVCLKHPPGQGEGLWGPWQSSWAQGASVRRDLFSVVSGTSKKVCVKKPFSHCCLLTTLTLHLLGNFFYWHILFRICFWKSSYM